MSCREKTLFKHILYLWLEKNQIRWKEQTYAKYLYMIQTHIVPVLGEMQITKLDASYVNRFLIEKINNGRMDGKGGLAGSYIDTIVFVIRAALDWAVKEEICGPIKGSIIRPSKRKTELEVLSRREQRLLERYLLTNINERKLGILLSLYTGLRIGEVCGLTWGDFDFDTNTIHVRHSVQRMKNFFDDNKEVNVAKTKLVLCDTKTVSSNRIIPIPSKFLILFKRYQKERDQFLLPGKTYGYTDPRTYQYTFHQYLKECKMRQTNYHALRHTFATRCIESGMDVKTLSELLGHSNVNITLNTYVHSSIEHKRNQLDIMTASCGQG